MALSGVILLVDDNHSLRRMLKVGLELSDFVVEDAAEGAAALTIAKRCIPGLVITDYEMPGMNGVELARHLRKPYPDLPIVFITGGALEPISSQVTHWQRVGLLHKPFEISALVSCVNNLLARSPQQV